MVEKNTPSRIGFNILNYGCMLLFAVVCFLPFWHVLMCSISEPRLLMANSGLVLWPLGKPTLDGYKFRLLSLHLVNGVDCYDSEKYFAGKTRAQAYREYAEAKAESILDWEDFDSVAHIGYVAKFSIYTGKERALVYEDAPDAFDAIFRHVIALGKCIEVNTSGYATTGDTFAHSSLIRRYIELGGENFTFGSDSHDTTRDYADVERAKEMVRALGGKYQVSFEGRKAIYWKI